LGNVWHVDLSGSKAVAVAIGEVAIAEATSSSIDAAPAEKGTASMRKPVAFTVATRFRRAASIRRAIEPVCAFAARGATLQTVQMFWMFEQVTAGRAAAEANVISNHAQSS
jgi:hypothetical protein